MAVRTPDLALLDLGRDFIPRRRATNERRDVGELVAPMIEIEHSGVVLAAIHAVVSVKVCAYRFRKRSKIQVRQNDDAGVLVGHENDYRPHTCKSTTFFDDLMPCVIITAHTESVIETYRLRRPGIVFCPADRDAAVRLAEVIEGSAVSRLRAIALRSFGDDSLRTEPRT